MEDKREENESLRKELKEERENNKLVTTIVIVLLMRCCVGGGFLLGAVQTVDKLPKVDEKETDEEVADETDEEVGELVDISASEVEAIFNNLDTLGTTVNTNRCGVMTFDYYKDHKITVNDISNDTVSYVVLRQLKNSGIEFNENVTFTKAQVRDIIIKTFGKNYTYEYKSIDYCPGITYDPSTELYKIGVPACGGACIQGDIKKMESYEAKGKKLEIMVRVLFSSKNPEDFKFFSDYSKTKVADIDMSNLESDSNFAKGSLYKLTFTKEDGNYVFVSSEPVV